MFGKIEAIVVANTSLLNVLQRSLSILEHDPRSIHWVELMSNELLNIQRPYRDYLAGYDIIKETEQKLLKKSEGFRQFCERTKEAMYDDGMGRVGLRELLMEPVQRITRYILIFEQMLKKMSSNDPARPGLLGCIATCNRLAVCELDDHLIKAATMWGLHRSIDHFPAILVKPGRYFIDSIDVLDIIPDQPNPTVLHCSLFLFNDTIVIAKKPSNGQLTGKNLAGLDDFDRLVTAMKKSKGTSSSLNSVVSGSTDFFSKSLGNHNTPTKLKKGSMRFKGLVDVHDVIVINEVGHVGAGAGTEVSFDLYLDRPPQDVSERWSERPYRHYVVCPPPAPALSGHEKSLSLSSHPTSSAHQPVSLHPTSHSLSHKSNSNSHQTLTAALAERDRFLDNLRKLQALVKAADDRSTVMRTKFINETETKGVIDSFWNLYDKQTYLTEQRKHRIVLQLVGTDAVDPLQFNTESLDAAPPLMIIRAHFNDPDDPDCRIHVRRKPNHAFPSLNPSIEKVDEELVVPTERLSGLIVRIAQAYGIADIPPRTTSLPGIFSAPAQQQQFSGTGNPSPPTRVFRHKSGSLSTENAVNSGLPHRLFGNTHHPSTGLYRTRSAKSSHLTGTAPSQPGTPSVPLREIQPTATRSPGGPVWYRNGSGLGAVMKEEESVGQPLIQGSQVVERCESNPSLYEDLPQLKEEKEDGDGSSSPAFSTLKGKGRAGSMFEEVEDDGDEGYGGQWNGLESGSRCSSVSGLSSYDGEEGDHPKIRETARSRGLVGPRQLVAANRGSVITRAISEPPCKATTKIASLGDGRRVPESRLPTDTDRFLVTNTGGSRNVSGSSLGKRSRSVEGHESREQEESTREDRVKRVQTLPLVVKKAVGGSTNSEDRFSANRASIIPEDDQHRSNPVRNSIANRVSRSQLPPLGDDGRNDNDEDDRDSVVRSKDRYGHIEKRDSLSLGVGTTDLFHDMKGRLKLMKSQLKKLKQEISKVERGEEEGKSQSGSGIGGVPRGSRALNSGGGSIPRSPRKLHLSEVAKSTIDSNADKSIVLTNPALNGLMTDLERALDGLDRKVHQVQAVESRSFSNLQDEHLKAIERLKKEITKKENDMKVLSDRNEVMKELQVELEVENNHLYEAFNEELDKMFQDLQLPSPSQSLKILVEDLKRMAEERGKLTTRLGSTQRQLELEIAKSECLESLLKEAGLLT